MPPVPHGPSGRLLARGAEALGIATLTPPLLINTEPRAGRGACIQCGSCVGSPCPSDGKNGTQNTMLPRALATGAATSSPARWSSGSPPAATAGVTGVSVLVGPPVGNTTRHTPARRRGDFRANLRSHAVAMYIPPGLEMAQDTPLFAKVELAPDVVCHRAHGIDHGAPIHTLIRGLLHMAPDLAGASAARPSRRKDKTIPAKDEGWCGCEARGGRNEPWPDAPGPGAGEHPPPPG